MHLSCKRASLYVQGAEMTSSSSSSETQCIVCGETDDNLYNCKDEASWKTLYLAAKTRGHKKIMALSIDENHSPDSFIKYHRDCRASFTHRKALLKLREQADKISDKKDENENIFTRQTRCANVFSSPVLPSTCIFCKKEKYKDKVKQKLIN